MDEELYQQAVVDFMQRYGMVPDEDEAWDTYLLLLAADNARRYAAQEKK